MNEPTKTEPKAPYRLNDYQKATVRVYGDGDYNYLADKEFADFDAFRDYLKKEIDDGQFLFLMVELASPDVEDLEEAQNRISRAIDELNDVFGALVQLGHAPTPAR